MAIHICKHDDTQSINRWFNECSRKQIPNVIVLNRSKYSRVEWDYISIDPNLDKTLFANEEVIMSKIEDIFHKYANPTSKYQVNAAVGYFDNLLPDTARRAAQEIYAVLVNALNDSAEIR